MEWWLYTLKTYANKFGSPRSLSYIYDVNNEKIKVMTKKEQLQKGNIKFTVKGITTYDRNENGEWGDVPQVFEVSHNGESINSGYRGMNVNKWGPTCVTLYTFNMLGKKTVGKINYKSIELCQ